MATASETEKATPDETAGTTQRARPLGLVAWLPVVAGVLLAPLCTWAAVEYVIVPRIQTKLAHAAAEGEAGAESAEPEAKGAVKAAPGAQFEFQNLVVNLAGTMGTRYLKTSLVVTGADPALKTTFEAARPQMTDVTLNVLSSLTLGDLEQPGAKNVIREKLVNSYNQVLGHKVADQVYFSDFVIQ